MSINSNPNTESIPKYSHVNLHPPDAKTPTLFQRKDVIKTHIPSSVHPRTGDSPPRGFKLGETFPGGKKRKTAKQHKRRKGRKQSKARK